PYFFNGLLDQGYYPDGIYTPYSPEGYIYDITLAKNMGFNMLRKHIKIEPELFYYYCDKLGIVVFQDMVNCGKYSFFLDTALPTIGIKRGLSRPVSKRRRAYFESTVKATQDILYNHPSVCYYTIFNEGWGQHNANILYKKCKEYDPTRIYDTASGWFKVSQSDVESEHVYFKKINLESNGKKPLVLSEFGGYSYKVAEHSFNVSKNYGYRTCTTREAFMRDMEELYRGQIITAVEKGLCASVLTQISDVEDETNGLVTYDRRVIKTDTEKMKDINREISDIFNKKYNI
ncbi:MAG: glycoside hydrolase family 2, partial [Clostridiales bacterium]|nr:glycoside hydrolase family 2 [Clostridiales bacterium]